MQSYSFTLNGAALEALADGALWWPSEQLLCVADLHLGKAERMARRGGSLIPPYDTRETLLRLSQVVNRLKPRTVVCLGDSFDDMDAQAGLRVEDHAMLDSLGAGRSWIWITGNHDPGPMAMAGTWRDGHAVGPLVFRHIAEGNAAPGEVSGHYHPKKGVQTRSRHVTRPCFLIDARRAILPAFGTYTGGLRCSHAALRDLMTDAAIAVLTGPRAIPVPFDA